MIFDWVKEPAWVSAIGTLVANIVLIVSAFMLRSQLRDTRRAIRSDSAQGAYALWLQVDQFFALHPELRPFLYEGKVLDSSLEADVRRRAESATEMFLDCMASSFHQLTHFKKVEPEAAEAYGNFLRERYQTQPALKQFIDEHAHWYPNSFVRFLRSEIEWLINEPPAQRPSAQQIVGTGAR
jgi:hypothetical protein